MYYQLNKSIQSLNLLLLVAVVALWVVLFSIVLLLGLFMGLGEGQPETYAVHSHYYSYVLYVVELGYEGRLEGREYFLDSGCEELLAFFIGVCHDEAIYMDKRHLLCLELLLIVHKNI